MKGRVIIDRLAKRKQNPGVNAPIEKFYKVNDVLKITDAVVGDTYDGNNLWYKLEDETYVWSGAVEALPECENLTNDDKNQYLISYRKRLSDGRINLDTKAPADELYFAPLQLPADSDSFKVNELLPKPFANAVTQAAVKVGGNRKHVFVYIHGYQAFASLKLDLFTHFVQNYLSQPNNKIAKAIFMVWPAQGLSRKKADDRALKAGSDFTRKQLFNAFIELSNELTAKGLYLNLIVHSFGHQLLNGMINPAGPLLSRPIFKNIFLMAPDITHLSVKVGGVELDNYYPKNGGAFRYEYNGLKKLGEKIHVFYNDQDILLYASTKKFVAKKYLDNTDITDKYRNLGNFGSEEILPPDSVENGIKFTHIKEVLKHATDEKEDLLHFPFREQPNHTQAVIEKIRMDKNYRALCDLDILFHLKRYPNHHRYLFTCKPMVQHVLSLLS